MECARCSKRFSPRRARSWSIRPWLRGAICALSSGASLAAPRRPLADAIADEWRAQAEFIDPAAMPMTRLANTIIDGVAAARDEVAGEIVKYLRSDLVCYRAATPQGLVARQSLHWDPILAWAKAALGAEFATVEGITHLRQPDEAI